MSLKGLLLRLLVGSPPAAPMQVTPSSAVAPPPSKSRASGPRDSHLSCGVLSVDSLRFVGQASQSPNCVFRRT